MIYREKNVSEDEISRDYNMHNSSIMYRSRTDNSIFANIRESELKLGETTVLDWICISYSNQVPPRRL